MEKRAQKSHFLRFSIRQQHWRKAASAWAQGTGGEDCGGDLQRREHWQGWAQEDFVCVCA